MGNWNKTAATMLSETRTAKLIHSRAGELLKDLEKAVGGKPSKNSPRHGEGFSRGKHKVGASPLERLCFITWTYRLRRVRESVEGLPGITATDWRVIRWSNSYSFPLAQLGTAAFSNKGYSGSETRIQSLFPNIPRRRDGLPRAVATRVRLLNQALARLGNWQALNDAQNAKTRPPFLVPGAFLACSRVCLP